MALWGTADSLYSVGTVSVDYAGKKITGSGTSFTAAGISTGDVITIGLGGTFGSAVISGITSDRLVSIATTQYLTGAVISGVAYSISERPIYTLEDSHYSSNTVGVTTTIPKHDVYGVDKYEIVLTSPDSESGISTQYGGIHAGWVGVQTYVDMHGNLRVKSETLVAMSEISSGTASYTSSGDAFDDSVFDDAIITILSQPVSVGVGTTQTATFSVTASVTPSYAPLTYQWYEDGLTLQTIGTNSPSVSIANTDASKDGYEYYVVITSGDVSEVSGIATMTVS